MATYDAAKANKQAANKVMRTTTGMTEPLTLFSIPADTVEAADRALLFPSQSRSNEAEMLSKIN